MHRNGQKNNILLTYFVQLTDMVRFVMFDKAQIEVAKIITRFVKLVSKAQIELVNKDTIKSLMNLICNVVIFENWQKNC